jgi:hypothetical protein
LRDPRTVLLEQWRFVAALVPHVGEENAVAAKAALQAERVGKFGHFR